MRALRDMGSGPPSLPRKQLQGIREHIGAATLGQELATAKAHALHEYRDEARRARRDVALIRGREGWMHRVSRKVSGRPSPTLMAAEKAEPVLDSWRRQVLEPAGEPPTPVEDPTARTLDVAVEGLRANSP